MIFRLGDAMMVRLPRKASAAEPIGKECQWLPTLAPHLPLPIPVPLAKGEPGEGYPFHWSICPWIDGENATLERLHDPNRAAQTLAAFISTLQKIEVDKTVTPDTLHASRGVPLATRDAATRAAIATLDGMIDTQAALAVWDHALSAPVWDRAPVWIHGDLHSGNLLENDGDLSAVIDFGCLTAGDPAGDLIVAWNLFSAETRTTFRAAIQVDDATWARGCGWALSTSVIALPYYKDSNLTLANISRYAIDQALTEYRAAIELKSRIDTRFWHRYNADIWEHRSQ